MPSITAKIKKLASIAEFPELRNGETTPDSGMAPSTPPEISSISIAIKVPARGPGTFVFIGRIERDSISSVYEENERRQIEMTPTNPHSSPMAGSTRSVCGRDHRGISPSWPGAPHASGRERP